MTHVPVIFMTGLAETEHIVRGLEAGGVDYVTKPIVIEEMLARIRVHLANDANDAVDGAHSTASMCQRVVALKRTTMRGAVHGRG